MKTRRDTDGLECSPLIAYGSLTILIRWQNLEGILDAVSIRQRRHQGGL